MPIIEITSDPAFNYFGSLMIWLIIYSMPLIIVFGFLVNIKKKL